jgi:transcriptional regulator with XRE-family HTH domain
MNDTPEFIRSLRKHLGLTQEEFAEVLGAAEGQAMVSRWETGKTRPSERHLVRIAELAGVKVDEVRGHRRELPISPKLAKELVLHVPADEHVRRWLINTIENAVLEAVPDEGVPLWLAQLRGRIGIG